MDMTILVIAEHDNAALKSATLHTIGAAGKIGGEIHVLVAGHNCGAAARKGDLARGISEARRNGEYLL